MSNKRIYLSPPHMGGDEFELVRQVFESNWIAPAGPDIAAFEREFSEMINVPHAAAVSSGTAALHLAMLLCGVGAGDEVLCSSFTFAASANAVRYVGARPVFIDSDEHTWNMNPALLAELLETRARKGALPKAVVLVHLYGHSADIDPILQACNQYEIPLVEDAAEALGATYRGGAPGAFGRIGVFSFNGNKIITTSGGGMFVSHDKKIVDRAHYLATQARTQALHYEHIDIGFNYRLSNVLAAIGRGQLRVLHRRVEQKRRIFTRYHELLGNLPGVHFMPEAAYGRCSRWLTCLTVDPAAAGTDRNVIIDALEAENIESRPTWKPMHLQPAYAGCEIAGGAVSQKLFEQGICLPSGTALSAGDQERIAAVMEKCFPSR